MTFSPLRKVRHGSRGSNGVLSELSLDGKDSNEAAVLIWERLQVYVKLESTRFLEIFREFDKDRSGTIDAAEFERALRHIGVVGASPKAVQAVIDTADPNGDGVLEYKELMRALNNFKFRGELPSTAAPSMTAEAPPLRTVDQIIAELQQAAVPPQVALENTVRTPKDLRSSTPPRQGILATGEKPIPTWVSKGALPSEQRQPPYSPDGPYAGSQVSASLDEASPVLETCSSVVPLDASKPHGKLSAPPPQLPVSTSIDPYSGYPVRNESSKEAITSGRKHGNQSPVRSSKSPSPLAGAVESAAKRTSLGASAVNHQAENTHPSPSSLLLNEPGPYPTQHDPRAGLFVGPLVTTRELLLLAVERDPLALLYFSDQVRADREFVLAAVSRGGSLLEYAPPLLQEDREVCMTAVLHDGRALEFAGPELRDDKALVLMAVENNGFALGHCSEKLRNDHDVCLAAVSRDPMALEFASTQRRADKKVVLAAVRIQGVALQFADPVLQADPSVVSVAVAQNGIALNYARLRANESIVHGQSVQEALKWREVVLVAAAQDGHALWAAPELLQDDREVVLTAVAQNGLALKWASKRLRSDPEVIKMATAQSSASVVFAADEWWTRHMASSEETKDTSRDSDYKGGQLLSLHPSCHALAPPLPCDATPLSSRLHEGSRDADRGTKRSDHTNVHLHSTIRPRHEPLSYSPVRSRGLSKPAHSEPTTTATRTPSRSSNNNNNFSSSPSSVSSTRDGGVTRGAAYEQAWEALRRQQFGSPPLLPDQPKRVPPMRMWSHEFNRGDRLQAAFEDSQEHSTPPPDASPTHPTETAMAAVRNSNLPTSGHNREVPYKDNSSRIMQHGVLAAIVELSRRAPPEPPLLRADAWSPSELPEDALHDHYQGDAASSLLRAQGHFMARYGPSEGAVRWELAGPMAAGARQEVQDALREALALDEVGDGSAVEKTHDMVEKLPTPLNETTLTANSEGKESVAVTRVDPITIREKEAVATVDAATNPAPAAATSNVTLEAPTSIGVGGALNNEVLPKKVQETIREKKARLARERAVGVAMSRG